MEYGGFGGSVRYLGINCETSQSRGSGQGLVSVFGNLRTDRRGGGTVVVHEIPPTGVVTKWSGTRVLRSKDDPFWSAKDNKNLCRTSYRPTGRSLLN